MDVNEELKFLGKFTKKKSGGGVAEWRGSGGGSGWWGGSGAEGVRWGVGLVGGGRSGWM